MIKKVLLTIFLSAVIIADLCSITVSADWKQISETEYEYYKSDNTKCSNGLFKIDGVTYQFDENGICLGAYSGWTRQKNDHTKLKYYKNGFQVEDWVRINDKFYYFSNYFTGEVTNEIKKISNVEASYVNNDLVFKFDIENLTNKPVLLGDFKLEKLTNNEWCLLTLSNNYRKHGDDVMGLVGKVKIPSQINISKMYDELEQGIYRIVDGDVNNYGVASDAFQISFDDNGQYIIDML